MSRSSLPRLRWFLGAAFLSIFLTVGGLASWPAHAQATNFAGKTITIVVPYDTGGTTDFEARAIARYLPDYLPGKPTIVVRNMPGGGGLIGVNYTGEIAKPDGLTLIMWTWNPIAYLVKDPGLRVPMGQFRSVGGLEFAEIAFMLKDPANGVTMGNDVVKAKKLWFGGLGASNFKDIMGRLQLDILGANYKYITGYQGVQDLIFAVQKNEIQFSTSSEASWIAQIKPNMVDKGMAVAVYQVGVPTANGTIRHRDLPDIPTFDETYRAIYNKNPSGAEWDLYSYLLPLRAGIADVVWLPPATPDDINDLYRTAFDKVMALPSFIDDYTKFVHAPPTWIHGPQSQEILDRLASTDPTTVKKLNDFVNAVANR
jgi:tripartite-type tricarboxylate transporter receptor subunit TctC